LQDIAETGQTGALKAVAEKLKQSEPPGPAPEWTPDQFERKARAEARAGTAGRPTDLPVRLLLLNGPDRPFTSVIAGLRCKSCGGKPAPVYLVAGQQRTGVSPPPSWAAGLVPRG